MVGNRVYLRNGTRTPSTPPVPDRLRRKDPVITKHEEQSDLGLGIVLNLISGA
jgi:hypothetical protein